MSGDQLKEQFAAFLRWEKRKRWETVLFTAVCYALCGALALTSLVPLLPVSVAPVWLLLGCVVAAVPAVIFQQRWTAQDESRALVALDKQQGLEERVVTAWDVLRHNDSHPAALLVVDQAGEKLKSFDPQKLFPRRWSWQAYSVLPLFGLWLALLWFDAGATHPRAQLRMGQTLAHQLKEFARELQEKAKSEGLKESLQAGKELEKLAQQNLDKKSSDEEFQKEMAGAAQKFASAGKAANLERPGTAAQSEQTLRDLKAELEAARDFFSGDGAPQREGSWLDRLASLPQLKRQFDRQEHGSQAMGQHEMKSFLEKMDKQVSGELDRRALLDAEQFLKQMMRQDQGQQGEANARASGGERQERPGAPEDGEKGRNRSHQPGSEPGKKTDQAPSVPPFAVGPSTQVKGTLGAGESSGVAFKGKPAPGKSTLAQEEIVANYRRQAEQDLQSERVPEALKETIRNYFLSLGDGKR